LCTAVGMTTPSSIPIWNSICFTASKICDAYVFLGQNFEEGDEICLQVRPLPGNMRHDLIVFYRFSR
jgi:hypothetical protein